MLWIIIYRNTIARVFFILRLLVFNAQMSHHSDAWILTIGPTLADLHASLHLWLNWLYHLGVEHWTPIELLEGGGVLHVGGALRLLCQSNVLSGGWSLVHEGRVIWFPDAVHVVRNFHILVKSCISHLHEALATRGDQFVLRGSAIVVA